MEVGQDAVADDRVLLDVLELLVGQRPALGEDVVADADLADVVQQAGQVDVALLGLLQAELAPQLDGRARHALAVAVGVRILGVDRGGQRARQPDQEVLDVEIALGGAHVEAEQRGERHEQRRVRAAERQDRGSPGFAVLRGLRRAMLPAPFGPRPAARRLLNARTHPESVLSATGMASRFRICGNRAPSDVSRGSLMST